MAADQDHDLGEVPIDPLLGQPRLVDDPRISIAQGATVLGKTVAQVHRLVRLGRLPRHGPGKNGRPLLLSEVEALRAKGDPIPVKAAARTLRRSIVATFELVAGGQLPLVPGTKVMVYPCDVAALAVQTRVAKTAAQKAAREAAEARSLPRLKGPPGYLNSKQTGERLGLTSVYVTQMAAEEKVPAIFQDGQWWFDRL
ncbi:hypothetical protein ACQPYH_06345 [Kribbella sp. CA-245084]|uniref:hypothetical protein n=1 Tax=Kribbella sp. CA-245084 TaxID=3239940 RepID=UPI003D9462B4